MYCNWWTIKPNCPVHIKTMSKNIVGALLLLAISFSGCKSTGGIATPMVDKNGYRLVWADEFNKEGKPDATAWRYEKGFVRNEEAQWYTEENAYCKNGFL